MPGYKITNFVQIDAKYLCKSCGLLLRDAVQTYYCGHHYCESCLMDMLTHEPFFGSVKCLDKSCNTQLGENLYFADRHIRREILGIITSCLFEDAGCEWRGAVKLAEDHFKECHFKPVLCTNTGCNKSAPLFALAQHQEEDCQFRTVVCNSCNLPIKWTDHDNHIGTCDYMHVTCPNCGKENIQLRELKKHLDAKDGDCTQKECPFREYGCAHSEKMNPDQLKAHLEACLVLHQLVFVKQMKGSCTNQHDYEGVATEVDTLKQSLITAETHISGHDWALHNLYQMIMDVVEDVGKLKGLVLKRKDGP